MQREIYIFFSFKNLTQNDSSIMKSVLDQTVVWLIQKQALKECPLQRSVTILFKVLAKDWLLACPLSHCQPVLNCLELILISSTGAVARPLLICVYMSEGTRSKQLIKMQTRDTGGSVKE